MSERDECDSTSPVPKFKKIGVHWASFFVELEIRSSDEPGCFGRKQLGSMTLGMLPRTAKQLRPLISIPFAMRIDDADSACSPDRQRLPQRDFLPVCVLSFTRRADEKHKSVPRLNVLGWLNVLAGSAWFGTWDSNAAFTLLHKSPLHQG